MRDTISEGGQAILSGPAVPAALLVEMVFATPLYLNSSSVDIDWNGQTWKGAGNLGTIDKIEDAANGTDGLKFTLSGVPIENLGLALSETIRNKVCRVYLAVLDPASHQIVDVPQLWTGTLDQMPIAQDKGACTIGVTAQHRGATFARVRPLRYTAGDQQLVSPGDTSLRFIQAQSNQKITWPAASFFRE